MHIKLSTPNLVCRNCTDTSKKSTDLRPISISIPTIVILIVVFTAIIIAVESSTGYAYAENYTFIRKWGTPCSIFHISLDCNTKAPGAISVGDGQFNYPTGVAVLSVDNVYVTDHDNMRVQKFTINGQFQTKWGTICIMNTTYGCNRSLYLTELV